METATQRLLPSRFNYCIWCGKRFLPRGIERDRSVNFGPVFLWLLTPHSARATTTLHGEAVCTACILHLTHEHLPAIRVHDGSTTRIYFVQSDPRAILQLGDFCAAPIPLVATGKTGTKDGRLLFDAQTVKADPPPARPPEPEGKRVLFPF